jgi:bifunctional UDP-N-acetylglucosamine pyrophosphorylase/glucosamine-1-phosphate N-acetyltransferase
MLDDSAVGDDCTVVASMLEGATLESRVDVGPFSHLRPGAVIESEVHIGNFAEVKNSRLGRGAKMGHFSYMGDAQVGKNVNIGAGAITCNYDGVNHNPSAIGDDAFIGCDTMLVAPVKVGERSITGAGAVVNRDVPPDSLAVGVPARLRKRTKKGVAGSS